MAKSKRLRKKLGRYEKFDHKECWNLDMTLAKFILPRLRVYKKENNGTPIDRDNYEWTSSGPKALSTEEWDEILDTMIWSFEEILTEKAVDALPKPYRTADLEAYNARVQLGLDNFAKWFRDLWW